MSIGINDWIEKKIGGLPKKFIYGLLNTNQSKVCLCTRNYNWCHVKCELSFVDFLKIFAGDLVVVMLKSAICRPNFARKEKLIAYPLYIVCIDCEYINRTEYFLSKTSLHPTYNTDETVADSAGTATAFLCGVKSKYGTIGVDDNIIRYNCSTVNKSKLSCIGDWALMSGKGAGVVTNMRVTHATPSPLYAASAERYWEHDGLSDKNCDDIAKQLVQNYPGKNLQVILGGGRTNFFPNTMADFEYKNMTGNRLDGVNLVDKWKAMKTKENVTHAFVWNKEQFDKIHLIAFILFTTGLFEPNHMKDITTMVNKDGTLKSERDPTLAEMTEKAIGVLQNNKNGFFLLVEGGLIDHFHHKNLAVRAISEVVEFDKAIEIALNITNSEETLIIVTADHSQSMQLNGYPKRGAPLFGQSSATHVGEDVVSYAQGPMAHLVAGVYEQNYIAHVMAYAARIGPYSDLKTSNSAKVNNLKASLSTGNSLQNVHSFGMFYQTVFNSSSQVYIGHQFCSASLTYENEENVLTKQTA
ncbi:Alkaline phosphatase, tissue-nonspecific isozyme [Nymphon striatum]|nr:Alkaline phosphatase, tissue-nonspecific isozyme [Nymphon striatum]